jgi:glycogen(starch) synthase
MSAVPPVSVIINTDGRAAILGTTLESLRYLRYPCFEVVVVPGPTADGTRELLQGWRGEIKVGYCPVRNIARSRNIGIGLAAGEVIAFLDDDEIPEPEWLADLVPALADPAVAVAGGWLADHTGKAYQARFETVDRFGNVHSDWERATPEFNFPLSFTVPHAMINSAYRRSALVDVCGFDEEFEYLLDETDLVCRFVDRGWHVVQTDRGIVHHKFLPSAIRNEQRVLTSWYSVIKNKTYFALMHGRRFAAIDRILAVIEKLVDAQRAEVRECVARGMLPPEAEEQFEGEAERAVREGIMRALSGVRRLGDPRLLRGDPAGFLPFRTRLPSARQRCLILLSGEYPPGPTDGAGRHVHALARAIAARGHQVHVLACGSGHDRIDFEAGVWVHRLLVREFPTPAGSPNSAPLPPAVWNYSMTMLKEAEEIGRRRPIAAVSAPLENAKAIAFLRDRKWPLVIGLDEPDPERRGGAAPLLAAERELLLRSDGLLAPDAATVAAIEAAYGLAIARDRLALVPAAAAAQRVEALLQLAQGGEGKAAAAVAPR